MSEGSGQSHSTDDGLDGGGEVTTLARTDDKTNLLDVDPKRVREIVAVLPTKKRPAMSKALKAACQHLKDSKGNYRQAFELASAMVENWWHMGAELAKLREAGLMDVGGRPPKKPVAWATGFQSRILVYRKRNPPAANV